VTLEYSPPGSDEWKIEPALVRTPAAGGFSFGGSSRAPRLLVYKVGPAKIPPTPFLVGDDAARHGVTDLAIIGSASARVQSDAYLLEHFYTIIQSLPADATDATILFAGGLPARDSLNPEIERHLKARLKGAHVLLYDGREIALTIAGSMLVPQPVAACATMLFTPQGTIRSNGDLGRMRFLFDIGGGTSDWTGRIGLTLIPGTEGGADIGLATAAAATLRIVQGMYDLPSLTIGQIMDLIRAESRVAIVHSRGEPIDIAEQIKHGIAEATQAFLAALPREIHTRLPEGEVGIAGGGGAKMAKRIKHDLGDITTVTLLPSPLTAVAEGIRRMARYKLRGSTLH
jgi:hypothetical protein